MMPVFALSVSDAATDDMLDERLEILSAFSERFPTLGCVRVRDDAMDADLLTQAVNATSRLGLEVIIESSDAGNLAEASFPGATVCSPGIPDPMDLIRMASACGTGVILSVPDTDRLVPLVAIADALGCTRIIMDPSDTSLKSCLESTVRLKRLMDSGEIPEVPIAVSAWSGEYALSMASVSVLNGGSYAVLDDLDVQSCAILDELISSRIRGASYRPLRRLERWDYEVQGLRSKQCISHRSHASIRCSVPENTSPRSMSMTEREMASTQPRSPTPSAATAHRSTECS